MRIGLLVNDHLDPEVVRAVGGDYGDLLFPSLFGPRGIEFVIYDAVTGTLPVSTLECDGWMTTGSRHSAYDDLEWIVAEGEFLAQVAREGRRPLVGVCFGHQLLASALGGRVERAPGGWGVGVRTFAVTATAPWMQPPASEIRSLMSHRDQVSVLPDGAEVWSAADYCPAGGYLLGDSVVTIQGHPEFVPQLSRVLMERRRELIGETVVDAGLASLAGGYDRDLVADWLVAFLTGGG